MAAISATSFLCASMSSGVAVRNHSIVCFSLNWCQSLAALIAAIFASPGAAAPASGTFDPDFSNFDDIISVATEQNAKE